MTDLATLTALTAPATGDQIPVLHSGGAYKLDLSFIPLVDSTAGIPKLSRVGGGITADADTNYLGLGAAYYSGAWRNTTTGQGGAAIRNAAGVLTISSGSNPGAAGSTITDWADRLKLDNAGNVSLLTGKLGVGTSSPAYATHSVASSAGATTYALVTDNGAGGAGVNIAGLGFANGGNIKSSITAAVYGNDYIAFNVNGNVERMRIDASGNLLVGQTSNGFSNSKSMTLEPAQGYMVMNHVTGQATGSNYVLFAYGAGQIGSITQSGTTGVAYNTTSDRRLKHDIIDAPSAGGLIDAIKVRSFKWNANNSEQRYGFVAQELLEVAPEAVSVPSDPDAMMAVDYSKLVPMLVLAVQELRAKAA